MTSTNYVLAFAEQFGLLELYRTYFAPDYEEEYKQDFREYCQTVGRPIMRLLVHFFIAMVILTWPADYLFYGDQPRIISSLRIWRVTALAVFGFLVTVDILTSITDRYMTELFLSHLLIVVFAIYYAMGELGGLDTPWFYSAYSLPFTSLIFFNLNFVRRCLLNLGIAVVPLLAYFGFHPGYLSNPYVGTPILLIFFFGLVSVLLGHVIHNVYKRSFIQSRRLERSLDEKETLIEEIHHRVKNNLQVITSLLNMQMRESGSKGAREQFREVINRVKSMALIHETLYQSEHLSKVNLPEYVRNLIHHLIDIYGSNGNLDLQLDIVDTELEMDSAIACGLIINEAVSNSLQHGLSGSPDDRIEVVMQAIDNETMELKISDNGRGMPEDFSPDTSSSTVIFLIQSLAGYELNGTVDLVDDDGVTVLVRFNI
ncbi:MAG: sensor histidine kinase [bacterium]